MMPRPNLIEVSMRVANSNGLLGLGRRLNLNSLVAKKKTQKNWAYKPLTTFFFFFKTMATHSQALFLAVEESRAKRSRLTNVQAVEG